MWHWQIQVVGDRGDLEFLARHFSTGSVRIFDSERNDGFLLEAGAFDSLLQAEHVRERASELLQILSSVLQIERGVVKLLSSGAAIRKHDNGREEAYMFGEVHVRPHYQT